MSQSSELTVLLPADLHARPAGQFSRAAARFASSVVVVHNGREADARSVLLVMSLGATKGSEITLRAVGEDADDAVRTLGSILESVAPEVPASG